jgi:hypothetical protein
MKRWLPYLVLVVALLWPVVAAAKDLTPDTCLSDGGMCFAGTHIFDNTTTETDPDGTAMGPWLVPRDGEADELRNNMVAFLQNPAHLYGDGPFYFAFIKCRGENEEFECETLWWEYDSQGELLDRWEDPGVPPVVGVDVPFSYLMGGGVLAGVLLLGIGVVIRRRAR